VSAKPARVATRTSARKRNSPLLFVAIVGSLLGAWLVALPVSASSATSTLSEVEKGEYIFHAAGCFSCHTDVDNDGPPLAGGRALQTPFGTFYSPNITPDLEHGIGDWSDDDFVRALRKGVAPDGSHYYPAFPYTSYTRMRREDMLALKAYLFSRTPVARPNRPHDLPWYLAFRPSLWLWKQLYFDQGEFEEVVDRSPTWNRGAYLVLALGHCAECHSPRNRLGAVETEMRFAGTRSGPGNGAVPNITPDVETGIGGWPRGDIAYYFQTGADPDGDYAGGEMAEVIDEGLSRLDPSDLEAMAEYLRSLPPVAHSVERPKTSSTGEPRNRDPWE
jgi:mono/diheme cytochrome c family protein